MRQWSGGDIAVAAGRGVDTLRKVVYIVSCTELRRVLQVAGGSGDIGECMYVLYV